MKSLMGASRHSGASPSRNLRNLWRGDHCSSLRRGPSRATLAWSNAVKGNVALCLFAAASLAPGASAQRLDEIVIYGQKDERALKDAPISVSVLSAAYLEDRRFQTLEQITAFEPGVDVSKNSGASKVFVRGIGSQGNAGLDQSAATFIDGIYFGRSRSNKAALIDVEQVEILKGPQSVHLGVNSSAGAFVVQTRAASLAASEGFADLQVGNYGEIGGTLAYNLAATDTFALRGVVSADRSSGFWDIVDPVTGELLSNNTGGNSQLYRLSAVWQPIPSFEVRTKLEKQRIDRDNPFAWQPSGCDNLFGLGLSTQAELDAFWAATGSTEVSPLGLPFSCEPDFADNVFDENTPVAPFGTSLFDAEYASVELNWDLGPVLFTSLTGAYDTDFGFEGNDLTHGNPNESRLFWSQDDNRQVSQELRLISQYDGPIQWLAGAYWHSGRIDYETGDADQRNPRNPQFIRTEAAQDETIVSVFGKADWQVTPTLLIDGGLRWTRVEKLFSGVDERIRQNTVTQPQRADFLQTLQTDLTGNPAAYTAFGRQVRGEFTDEERSFSDVLPSIALIYTPDERINLYYRWSEGYKAGGFNFRLNGLDETTLDFDAETVSAHEIGVKLDWIEQNLSVAAALFVSDYDGLQQNSNRGDDGVISAAVIRNAAAASSDGIEISVNWSPIEQVTLDWAATWLDAQFDDFQGADCTRFQSVVSRTDVAAQFGAERLNNRCSQDLSGARLAHAPEFSSRAALIWQPRLFDGFDTDTSIEWFYSDGFFTSPQADPLRRQAAFHKLNARLGIAPTSGRWSFDVILTNLTNELTARQLGQDDDAAVSGLVDDPRRIGARLRVRF